MLDKLLKASKGEEETNDAPEMTSESPKLKARKELLMDLKKMAMDMMSEHGMHDDSSEPKGLEGLKASVVVAEPAQEESLESGDSMEFANSPKGLGNDSDTELSMTDEEEQTPESLKARIKELEAKLAAKA